MAFRYFPELDCGTKEMTGGLLGSCFLFPLGDNGPNLPDNATVQVGGVSPGSKGFLSEAGCSLGLAKTDPSYY